MKPYPDFPEPHEVAPVKAAPESRLCDDWPILFRSGSGNDGDDWGLCTDSVRGSELMDLAFPGDAKSDAEFIAALINAYREGKLVWKTAEP